MHAVVGRAIDFAYGLPSFLVLTAAALTALTVIWRKGVMPVRDFVRRFKAWMDRTEAALDWVETQMRPNGGSTLVDKVDMLLEHDAERDQEGLRYGKTIPSQEETPS